MYKRFYDIYLIIKYKKNIFINILKIIIYFFYVIRRLIIKLVFKFK